MLIHIVWSTYLVIVLTLILVLIAGFNRGYITEKKAEDWFFLPWLWPLLLFILIIFLITKLLEILMNFMAWANHIEITKLKRKREQE